LPLLGRVLEMAPGNPAARELALAVAGSTSEACVHAAELLERASSVDSNDARQGMLEKLLEVTQGAADWQQEAPFDLATLGRQWFDRLLEIADPERAFAIAMRAAVALPTEESIWEKLESLGQGRRDPDAVVRAYSEALDRDVRPDVAELLGRRLASFAERSN